MPKIVPMEERAVRVNISLNPKTLAAIDSNVLKLQNFLVSKGVERKEVEKNVNRSALLKELVSSLATEAGLHSVQAGFAAVLGADISQIGLFDNE